jgi:fatty aldehyde-generating acyl-ACP reductase
MSARNNHRSNGLKRFMVSIRTLFALFIFIVNASRDLLIFLLPRFLTRVFIRQGAYAFLVHPRDLSDVLRRFPAARYIPSHQLEWILMRFWPVLVSRVTGLRSVATGKEKIGYFVAYMLTPEQMHSNKEFARRRILQTAKFAEKLGCNLIGLGALTSSMTHGGTYLLDKVTMGVTAGSAYTVAIILRMIEEAAQKLEVRLDQLTVAIVGAAGYMGITCSKILSEEKRVGRLLLIERSNKRDLLEQHFRHLQKSVCTWTSTQLDSLKQADFIIMVTNSAEILVRSEYLKPGAVVFDDTQPRNIPEQLVEQRPDVLVLDVSAFAPSTNLHFPLGFPNQGDVFTCLAETMILAANEWKGHYAVGHFDPRYVYQIAKWGDVLGFKAAEFRSFNKLVEKEKIEHMRCYLNSRPPLGDVPPFVENKKLYSPFYEPRMGTRTFGSDERRISQRRNQNKKAPSFERRRPAPQVYYQ